MQNIGLKDKTTSLTTYADVVETPTGLETLFSSKLPGNLFEGTFNSNQRFDDAGVLVYDAGWSSTDFIPIKNGIKYYINEVNGNHSILATRFVAIYNEAKTFINCFKPATVENGYLYFTASVNGYMKINFKTLQLGLLRIFEGSLPNFLPAPETKAIDIKDNLSLLANKKIFGYSSYGVGMSNNFLAHSSLSMTGCVLVGNNLAVSLASRGEFATISNCQFVGNVTAVKIQGGNNQITSNIITDNNVGIEIINGSNHAHGIIANCQINHNYQYGLKIAGISLGMTITGCHFFDNRDNRILIENCTGFPIVFSNCVIASPFTIRNNTCPIIFNNCTFLEGYATTANSQVQNTSKIQGTGNYFGNAGLKGMLNITKLD